MTRLEYLYDFIFWFWSGLLKRTAGKRTRKTVSKQTQDNTNAILLCFFRSLIDSSGLNQLSLFHGFYTTSNSAIPRESYVFVAPLSNFWNFVRNRNGIEFQQHFLFCCAFPFRFVGTMQCGKPVVVIQASAKSTKKSCSV